MIKNTFLICLRVIIKEPYQKLSDLLSSRACTVLSRVSTEINLHHLV